MPKSSGRTAPPAPLSPKHHPPDHAAEADVPPPARSGAAAHALSIEERTAAGKALRDRVPRVDQAAWEAGRDRPDPLDILRAADADRLPDLVPIRYGRMLQSPFAFYRGSAGLMAADLARTPATGIRVQACGDCHMMNFGGFATPERNIIFDINDFDETLPAPWEWDVKRLAASFVLAARSIGLSDAKARAAALATARSYRKHLADFAAMHPLEVWYARLTAEDVIATLPKTRQPVVRARVAKAAQRSGSELDFPRLAGMVGGRLSIRDTPPLIFHPEVARDPGFHEITDHALSTYGESLSEERRVLLGQYHYVDAAIKVVGVGSVGRRCWIVLMMSASNDPLFLQFKEAVESVLEPYAGKSVYPQHGQRVVIGQRLMQPASDLFLGWFIATTGKHFYVRQLRDAKIKPLVETFDEEMLLIYARACGWALARAHARGGDAAMISGYLGNSDQFDEALGNFGLSYADQAERDHAALQSAVQQGTIDAYVDA